jgi:CRISPR-associated protein Cas2
MYILITYDINTTSQKGQTRLRNVAKTCINYGQRVQNSVFECKISEAQYLELQHKLIKIIDKDLDSIRFYRLGENYNKKVKHIGAKESYKVDEPIIL